MLTVRPGCPHKQRELTCGTINIDSRTKGDGIGLSQWLSRTEEDIRNRVDVRQITIGQTTFAEGRCIARTIGDLTDSD